jgi:hypothetical protein
VRDRLWDGVVAGAPLALYVATLAPTVFGLDSAELTTGAAVLGIVHAPGAPTYLLLAHLFTWLPVGDVGYRVNLFSAVTASIAVWLLYRTLLILTASRAIAVATAWLLAFSYYFWVSAVAAELYAPHAMFVAAAIYLVTRWREGGRPADLYLLALSCGLGTGNHLSMTLLAPGIAWLALVGLARRRPSVRVLATASICFLAGVAVYVYLPLRYSSGTPLNYARDYWHVDLSTLDGFFWMVSARMFRGFMFAVPTQGWGAELAMLLSRLVSNFIVLGALLGFVGLIERLRACPAYHFGLLLLVVGHAVFYLGYAVADKVVMFGPIYLVWSIWIAFGALTVARLGNQRLGANWRISPSAVIGLLAFGVCLYNFPLVDLSDDWSARRRGEQIFGALEPGATHFGTWSDVPILEYLQVVEGQRPDVRTVNLFFVGDAAAAMAKETLSRGATVYTSAPGLLGDSFALDYEKACGCYRIRERGPGQTSLDRTVETAGERR